MIDEQKAIPHSQVAPALSGMGWEGERDDLVGSKENQEAMVILV